jgi:hypothetical protein
MKRAVLTVLTPPVAAARYGCAGFCAAPISVFWITGIVAIVYGVIGGPTNLMGPSWNTVVLGFTLWGIAVVWASVTLRSADVARCDHHHGAPRHQILSRDDEPDPFDEVRKVQ